MKIGVFNVRILFFKVKKCQHFYLKLQLVKIGVFNVRFLFLKEKKVSISVSFTFFDGQQVQRRRFVGAFQDAGAFLAAARGRFGARRRFRSDAVGGRVISREVQRPDSRSSQRRWKTVGIG